MYTVAVPLGLLNFRNPAGQTFRFQTFALSDAKNLDVSCVYAVTALSGGQHTVMYVGQTERLCARFSGHHKESMFVRHRATHIAVLVVENHAQRLSIESDLIAQYSPPCND